MSHKRRSTNLGLLGTLTASDEERFRLKFEQGLPDACWEWKGSTFGSPKHQYGQFTLNDRGTQRHIGAHVVSFRLATGSWPEPGQKVMHSCDNPPCVNPAHLSVGTHTDNVRDASRKGRYQVPRPRRQKLSVEQIAFIRARVAAGELQTSVAAFYGVSKTLVGLLVRGQRRQYDAPLQPRLVKKAS